MTTHRFCFNTTGLRLFDYVDKLYQPDSLFPYPLQKGLEGSFLGSVFACLITHMLDRVDELKGRDVIAQTLLKLRDEETGLIRDPGINPEHFLNPSVHSPLYVDLQNTYFAHICLHALGISFDSRVPWIRFLFDRESLFNWLDRLDWRNPWLVSNLDMFIGVFLLEWQQMDPDDSLVSEAMNQYFAWHNRHQNQTTGFWGDQEDRLSAMAGAYHVVLHYDYCRHSLARVRQMIDATLGLVWRDGLFVYGGGGGSCEDMDAVDLLVRLSLKSDYRAEYVGEVLETSASIIGSSQLADGGFSWRVNPGAGQLLRLWTSFGKKWEMFARTGVMALFKCRQPSHFTSTIHYSGLSSYPYRMNRSDMWSSWFRPLAIAMVAGRYPERFSSHCDWKMPHWPGLGFDPFTNGRGDGLRKVAS